LPEDEAMEPAKTVLIPAEPEYDPREEEKQPAKL
jgi:hypothetical protein